MDNIEKICEKLIKNITDLKSEVQKYKDKKNKINAVKSYEEISAIIKTWISENAYFDDKAYVNTQKLYQFFIKDNAELEIKKSCFYQNIEELGFFRKQVANRGYCFSGICHKSDYNYFMQEENDKNKLKEIIDNEYDKGGLIIINRFYMKIKDNFDNLGYRKFVKLVQELGYIKKQNYNCGMVFLGISDKNPVDIEKNAIAKIKAEERKKEIFNI